MRVLACIYTRTREFENMHTRVAIESLASGHAWTDKLLVSGTVQVQYASTAKSSRRTGSSVAIRN